MGPYLESKREITIIFRSKIPFEMNIPVKFRVPASVVVMKSVARAMHIEDMLNMPFGLSALITLLPFRLCA